MCDFPLGFWAIRPSEFFGARRNVVLRSEAYAWAPVLRSFEKPREVGVSSFLSFTLCLSVLSCFGWFEALNDRLIGTKSWNRIVGNSLSSFGQSVQSTDSFGAARIQFML